MSIYLNNIPTGLINLDTDYKNLQNNFSQLDISFGINHFPFSENSIKNGKHTFINMINNVNIPSGVNVLVQDEGTLYTKTNATITDLYYTPDNTGNEYQITRTDTSNFATFSTNTVYPGAQVYETGGWTFLPGGLILQYGTVKPGQNTSQTGTTLFPINFTSAPFVVLPTAISRSAGVGNQERVISIKDTSTTNNQFEWTWDNNTSNYVGFSWVAIGI